MGEKSGGAFMRDMERSAMLAPSRLELAAERRLEDLIAPKVRPRPPWWDSVGAALPVAHAAILGALGWQCWVQGSYKSAACVALAVVALMYDMVRRGRWRA